MQKKNKKEISSKWLKYFGVLFLVSLFFVAPIVTAIYTYSNLLSKDSVELILNTSLQEEEEEKEFEVENQEIKFLTNFFLNPVSVEKKEYLKELKSLKFSLFDPDLFIPPPKFIL